MDRRKIEIIRHEDHLLTVKPNDAFEDLMRSVPIYMNDNGRSRLHGYDHFNVYKYVNLEKFSTSYVGNEFASIGAFRIVIAMSALALVWAAIHRSPRVFGSQAHGIQ